MTYWTKVSLQDYNLVIFRAPKFSNDRLVEFDDILDKSLIMVSPSKLKSFSAVLLPYTFFMRIQVGPQGRT